MNKQRFRQKKFVTFAFDGPNTYTGRDGRLVKEMGLNDTHFDAMIELLAGTLQEIGVADDQIQEVGRIGESVRDDVIACGAA